MYWGVSELARGQIQNNSTLNPKKGKRNPQYKEDRAASVGTCFSALVAESKLARLIF